MRWRCQAAPTTTSTPATTKCARPGSSGDCGARRLSPAIIEPLQRRAPSMRAARPMPFVYRAAVVAHILKAIVVVYKAGMPIFLTLSIAAYVVMVVVAVIRRSVPPLLVIATIAAIVVKSRIALLAYLDATSVP